jgi:hypothetical protein
MSTFLGHRMTLRFAGKRWHTYLLLHSARSSCVSMYLLLLTYLERRYNDRLWVVGFAQRFWALPSYGFGSIEGQVSSCTGLYIFFLVISKKSQGCNQSNSPQSQWLSVKIRDVYNPTQTQCRIASGSKFKDVFWTWPQVGVHCPSVMWQGRTVS